MEFARVVVPAAPVRRKPRHQREMTSQLLFGEAVEVIAEKGALWVRVRALHDQYEGWMTRNLLQEIAKKEAMAPSPFVTSTLLTSIQWKGDTMHLPMGASLPAYQEGTGLIGGISYTVTAPVINREQQAPNAERLLQFAEQWLNAPYLWGGRTLLGVDCSGFAQVNFKMIGLDLARDAWQQAQQGEPVKKLKNAQAGDLAFFDDKDEIVHVGILMGPDRIIHASGKVRIDVIDKKGITNGDTGLRTHRLKAIRRYW